MLTRRTMLRSAMALPILAAACATTPTTPAQIIADIQGVITGLQQAAPVVFRLAPKLLSAADQATVAQDLALAAEFAGGLSTGIPAARSANTVLAVERYLNGALQALAVVTPAVVAAFPELAPASMAIQAAVVLLPVLETFVSGFIGPAPSLARASVTARGVAIATDQGMSIAQAQAAARLTLHIPVVR